MSCSCHVNPFAGDPALYGGKDTYVPSRLETGVDNDRQAIDDHGYSHDLTASSLPILSREESEGCSV